MPREPRGSSRESREPREPRERKESGEGVSARGRGRAGGGDRGGAGGGGGVRRDGVAAAGAGVRRRSGPVGGAEGLKVVFLGGVEELGKNCYALEYGDDIVVLDCGLFFSRLFLPGTTYTMPDLTYLKENKEKIRACVITRAHPSHSGFASIVSQVLHAPLYATQETAEFIRVHAKVYEDKRLYRETPSAPRDLKVVGVGEKVSCGSFSFSFFETVKGVPEAVGVSVGTPLGEVVFADTVPPEADPALFPEKPLVLMLDSLFAEKRGECVTEDQVVETVSQLIDQAAGRRVIMPATPVQAFRFSRIVDAFAGKRPVVVEGDELRGRLDVLHGLKRVKTPLKDMLTLADAAGRKDFGEALVILSATMEDPYLPLTRLAEKEDPHLEIGENDTVITPSVPYPGYGGPIQNLYGRMSRFGAVIEMYDTDDLSKTSHARQKKLTEVIRALQPTYFIPVHGYHYMLTANHNMSQKNGVHEENTLVPNNGEVFVVTEKGLSRSKDTVSAELTTLEGVKVSDEGLGQVIADRRVLEKNGFFYIVTQIDRKTYRLRKTPDIITRGFIYIRESQEIIQRARLLAKKIVEAELTSGSKESVSKVKKMIKKEITSLLQTETDKRPFVLIDIEFS